MTKASEKFVGIGDQSDVYYGASELQVFNAIADEMEGADVPVTFGIYKLVKKLKWNPPEKVRGTLSEVK